MSLRPLFAVLFAASLALLSACTSATTPATETSEPEETAQVDAPVEGLTAFWEMYDLAYQWSADIQPLSLKSGTPGDATDAAGSAEGNAPVWNAMFVSPSRMEAREFTYRATTVGTARKGVTAGPIQSWGGPVPNGEPFTTSEMVLDSSEAVANALPEVKAWLAQHPDEPVSFYLGKETRFPAPVWAVTWGSGETGRMVIVNARDGKIITP